MSILPSSRELVPLQQPKEALPNWQIESMRKVGRRALYFSFAALVGALAIGLLFARLAPEAGRHSWFTPILLSWIYIPSWIVSFSYRQGVRDALDRGAHSEPSPSGGDTNV